MTPDDYDALEAEALDEPAFSNSDEGDGWIAANCNSCFHDRPIRNEAGPGCPLLLIAMVGKRPMQWLDGPRGETGLYRIDTQYVCTEQRGEADPDPTPRPIPDPPGQGVLLPREPYTGHRMLTGSVDACDNCRTVAALHPHVPGMRVCDVCDPNEDAAMVAWLHARIAQTEPPG